MFNKPIRCISCKKPFCEPCCPCGNHIRDIIALVKEGKEVEAASLLYSTNPFPEWTSSYCDHTRNCRGHCILGLRGEPFDFPELEHYLSQTYPRPIEVASANGKRIAIIGAGPAGLSAAYFLAKKGFAVEVFDKESEIGGVLLKGIPTFRYDKKSLPSIREDLQKMGVTFHLGKEIQEEEMSGFCNDFEKIILCIGAEKENTLGYDQYHGVTGGLSLLYDLVLLKNDAPYKDAKKAFVWGGGNVAMDCARSLIRLGVPTSIIYRRGKEEMPASVEEIAECEADGVSFQLLTNIKELRVDQQGNLLGAKMVKMALGEKDESGRASFHEITGSEYEESFDLLIPALGEKVILPSIIEGNDKFILCGDCRYGAKNIASAIKDGREVAASLSEE